LKGFELIRGEYQELQPNANGWLWSQQLELYLGIYKSQLRFFTSEGQLILTPQEMAEQAQQKLTEMESLLVRYREQFGELPH
jgi:hypothetical protein